MELNERFGLGQFAVPTVRIVFRKRRIVGFIDLLRHRSAMILAVVFTALASWLLRIGSALLTERSGLTLSFALDFFETASKQLDLLD
ncbi:hypothetical protein [Rubripirellula lacrimiformis]|uniref:hypothetical protein n=1 Tax=Rubripirellula lacrimiformis TaxID=1930273 RepID=UPI001FE74C1D|nr:hypothetical protein [Rubripirellula lacrimiformis]